MAITLAEIKTAVRARCDMTNSNFNEAGLTGLASFINTAYQRLYDKIVATYEDYFVEHFDFTITSNQDGYDIPESIHIYKLNGLDYNPDGEPSTVSSFQWAERNKYNWITAIVTQPFLYQAPMVYCYLGDRIVFRPINQSGGNFRCYYIPDLELLTDDDSTILPSLDKWVNYVIVSTAIKLLDSEQSDTSALMAEFGLIEQSIEGFARNRDANNPKRVSDTRGFGMGFGPSTFTRFS